ncbi:ubiquitin carboxyl-terminal hydrolase 45-like isoform X2 [Dysidea avara]|uniref:ubiquitin carboxyl-terminal hydrolase 45-like isoform X2 n=1 Tax=Dysidea avara TaxID=196820 RepID=UPI00331F9218
MDKDQRSQACRHIAEVKAENVCKEASSYLCPKCIPLLWRRSDVVYVCLRCGFLGCNKHYSNENGTHIGQKNCQCTVSARINTGRLRCWECSRESQPSPDLVLPTVHKIKCFHLRMQRVYERKPLRFKRKPLSKKCDTEDCKTYMHVCLECGLENCCMKSASLHNVLDFYHYLSVNVITKMIWCHACEEEVNLDDCDDSMKERCNLILELPPPDFPIPIPIPNFGNTCYLNAVIQNLRNCQLLKEKYQSVKRTYNVSKITVEVDFPVGIITTAVIEVLCAKDKRALSSTVRSLHNLIRKSSRQLTGGQQDSHELLRFLFDKMRKEEIDCVKNQIYQKFNVTADKASQTSLDTEQHNQLRNCLRQAMKIETVIDEVFGGQNVNTVICRECLTPLQLIEPFLDHSLPIAEEEKNESGLDNDTRTTSVAENSSNLRAYLKELNLYYQHTDDVNQHTDDVDPHTVEPYTVEQCLNCYTVLDVLDENNKFICDKCNQKMGSGSDTVESLCSKQLLIHTLPPVLTLHIKRFHLYPTVTKNDRHIKFPLTLDLTPFVTAQCFKTTAGKILYGLTGVIVHTGSLKGGHYYTYLRVHKQKSNNLDKSCYDESVVYEGDWYLANDSHVDYIAAGKKGIPERISKSSAYLLFYEQLPVV